MKNINEICKKNLKNDLGYYHHLFIVTAFLFMSGAITFFFKKLYYKIFPWVLSKNVIFPEGTITPWIQSWAFERDGIEIYVLYIFMFLIIGSVFSLGSVIFKFRTHKVLLGLIFSVALLLSSMLYLGGKFSAPPSVIGTAANLRLVYSLFFGALLVAILYWLKKISSSVETFLTIMILLPFCFVATEPIAISNYVYIFSPAQKMLEGFKISEIYFQYDFFVTALAALWMKLGLALVKFQILGQAANFVAILGVYLISKKLFRQRILSCLLVIALIVFRIASAPWDPVFVFQITPLRLDLWLIPFTILLYRGPRDWLITLSLGVLILIHGSFGLIYTVGYIQLVGTLILLSIGNLGFKPFLEKYFNLNEMIAIATRLSFLLLCVAVSRTVFADNIVATSWYQKIGIGFIPIAQKSFFWFLPIVFSGLVVLLVTMRNVLSFRYIASGFALLYFTLGNCIYFFGRSHEMNLFSIAIPLIFLFFYTLDALDRWLNYYPIAYSKTINKELTRAIAVCLIVSISYKCYDRIINNISMKIRYGKDFILHANRDPFTEDKARIDSTIKEIRDQVGKKVPLHFMLFSESDQFLFYQVERGNTSFCYPMASCVFVSEVIDHAQSLLDKGSYILFDHDLASSLFDKKLSNITFRYTTKSQKYVLVGKKPPTL